MNLQDFQFLDKEEPIDNSIIKRDFTKIYHQRGANPIDSNQNVHFIFGENNNYHQIGNTYLEFDITTRDTACSFTNASVRRLVNSVLLPVLNRLLWQRQSAWILKTSNMLVK